MQIVSFVLKLLCVENQLESVMLLGSKNFITVLSERDDQDIIKLEKSRSPPLTFRNYVGHLGRLRDECAVLRKIIQISCLLCGFNKNWYQSESLAGKTDMKFIEAVQLIFNQYQKFHLFRESYKLCLLSPAYKNGYGNGNTECRENISASYTKILPAMKRQQVITPNTYS